MAFWTVVVFRGGLEFWLAGEAFDVFATCLWPPPRLNQCRTTIRENPQSQMKQTLKQWRGNLLVKAILLVLAAGMGMAKSSPMFEQAPPGELILILKCFRGPDYATLVPAFLPLLKNPAENVVRDACRTLAVMGNKEVIPDIEPLLQDKRPAVVKDAKDAIALLNGTLAGEKPAWAKPNGRTLAWCDPKDIIKVLKVVRSPEYAAMVPAILPLLHHDSGNVIRDACRTLAVMGDKSVIPAIEPLLKDKREDVRKDAEDALATLRARP